jgi:hypothetical protein
MFFVRRPYRTFLTVFRKNYELYRTRTLTEHLILKTFFDGVEYKISDEKASKIQYLCDLIGAYSSV